MDVIEGWKISKFIRDRALNKQIKVRKNIILTDRNLRNMINDISTRIAKIGVDYNQATKQLNALSKKTRADGSPVINARAANYYLAKVATMTKELKQTMDQIIEMVEDFELKQTAPQEQINNN